MIRKITFFVGILIFVLSILSFSNGLLQSITYPYYLPTWQNGEFWQYSISKTASENGYAIYHKWLAIPSSTVTTEKYVVLQMRYFDDIPAYEYVILKEIHTNKDEILDIAYAPICNLSISSIKESLSYDFDFPLYVGKKWQVLFPTIKSSIPLPKNPKEDEYFPLEAEVTSTQTTITPAGKFNTIKVKERYNNGKTYEYWYSPKAKNYVKFLSVNGNTVILTEYGKIEDLKSYVVKMIKAMPKKYASQRTFVVNTLYQYGFFTLEESLKLQ
jgi:hypothetical protein